tara:strand:+ start:324 stop:635 length:312 start_codon:yes stop_codon:yes gene_type:complete
MDHNLMTKIDDIYTSYNIYKSIFITKIEYLEHIFKELNNKDYPVCKQENIYEYNQNNYRILLIDLDSYHNIKQDINIENITTVIYIGVFDQIDDIQNINQIFL